MSILQRTGVVPAALLAVLLPLGVLLPGCGSAPPAPPAPVDVRPAEPFPPVPIQPAERARREERLAAARAQLEARPDDPEAWIQVGSWLGFLGRYREAIDLFTRGLERFPGDARLLLHRGHRYLTVRDLASARSDLEAAAQAIAVLPDAVEEDPIPNPRGEPRTTLHGDIWYHLGLVRYLQDDLAGARAAWDRALAIAGNDDAWVAAACWQVLATARSGGDPAPLLQRVRPDMAVIENEAYLALLLVFRGDRDGEALWKDTRKGTVDRATVGYGLAAWDLAHGRREEGLALCRQVAAGAIWPAFGELAATVELARKGRIGGG